MDFKNTIVIMTSNIGSQHIIDLGPGQESVIRQRVTEALRAHFRPEFLNRIDDVVIFQQLTLEQLSRIVDMQLDRVRSRLAERKIDLQVTPAAMEYLANEGFDPVYGARPLKRVIQNRVLDRLAVEMLDGTIRDGDTAVVDLENGKITISGRSGQSEATKEPEVAGAMSG